MGLSKMQYWKDPIFYLEVKKLSSEGSKSKVHITWSTNPSRQECKAYRIIARPRCYSMLISLSSHIWYPNRHVSVHYTTLAIILYAWHLAPCSQRKWKSGSGLNWLIAITWSKTLLLFIKELKTDILVCPKYSYGK